MRISLLVAITLIVSGCAGGWAYNPQTAQEAVELIKATGSSGCFYIRGNSRPYADVSMMYVGTYGADAPKYDKCLEVIPPEARALAR